MDFFKNFARGTLSTGYNSSATSIVLTTGHGARFPATPFNAIWWNVSDYLDPADDPNAEFVRVTNISTDTMTVTRGQESITATTKNTAGKTYKIAASLSAKTLAELATLFLVPTTSSGTSPALTFTDAAQLIVHTMSGNTTWTASGYAAGRRIRLVMLPDTVLRTVSLPTFRAIEGVLADVPANKAVVLDLQCTDGTAGGVIATYGKEL